MISKEKIDNIILKITHSISIAALLVLGITISLDTFKNILDLTSREYMHIQLWVSLVLITTLTIEFIISPEKGKFIKSRIFFLCVCIPFLNIFQWIGLSFSREATYFLRFIPLLRGGYILMYFVRLYCKRSASYLLISYLIILLSSIYFFSLIFYVFEYQVNPNVKCYGDALWWSAMVASSEGSNIIAVTGVGRILSVIEVFLGITFFSIFTAYVIDLIKNLNNKK